VREKTDLAIFHKDTIFPGILSIRETELSLYSVCAELSLPYVQNSRNLVKHILSIGLVIFGMRHISLYTYCS
jgi:hypothetical protein